MKRWVPVAALAIALSPLAVVRPVRVHGRSMEPALRDGQLAWALWSWCSGAPARGEVWIVASPEGSSVKRVVGLPQERIESRDGEILRNGTRLQEPYLERSDRLDGAWDCGGGYLVLGDNRPQSRDGRAWGPLPASALRGRVLGL